MASSEPIPSVLRDTVPLRRIADQAPTAIRRPNDWAQLAADLITIVMGFLFLPPLFARTFPYHLSAHEVTSSIVSALMIGTICAFTGAYSRSETPLNIGNSVGLVKGLCCTAILMIAAEVHSPGSHAITGVTLFPIIATLLVAQRETIGSLDRRNTRALLYVPFGDAQQKQITRLSAIDGERLVGTVPAGPPGYLLKRTADVCGASALILLLSPLFLVVALAIRCESSGPILLRQRRIGRHGRPFYMWKLRSMYADAPRYARSPMSDADPRLTRVGRLIRRFSIDEIPQLLNVFAGNMSLVGPRPEMPFIVATYGSYERLRLSATPGMTGLWQISPARAMPIHENVHLDLFYIQHQSIFLDIAIMLRTVTATVRGIGAA